MNYQFLDLKESENNIQAAETQLNKEKNFLYAKQVYNELLKLEKNTGSEEVFIKGFFDHDPIWWELKIEFGSNDNLKSKKIKPLFTGTVDFGENLSEYGNKTASYNFTYPMLNDEPNRIQLLKNGLGQNYVEFNSLYMKKLLDTDLPLSQSNIKKTKI